MDTKDTQEESFNLIDFCKAERPNFVIPQDVQDTFSAMVKELNQFCKQNGMPFVASAVTQCSDSGYHLTSSANLPLGKFPEDFLAISELTRTGISSMLDMLQAIKLIQETCGELNA